MKLITLDVFYVECYATNWKAAAHLGDLILRDKVNARLKRVLDTAIRKELAALDLAEVKVRIEQ